MATIRELRKRAREPVDPKRISKLAKHPRKVTKAINATLQRIDETRAIARGKDIESLLRAKAALEEVKKIVEEKRRLEQSALDKANEQITQAKRAAIEEERQRQLREYAIYAELFLEAVANLKAKALRELEEEQIILALIMEN